MNDLEKSILSTLVYYDILGCPLTSWEVFKYLNKKGDFKVDLNEVLNILDNSSELSKVINQKNGLYFLKGRQKIVKQRIERQIISDKKWKKARRIIRFLQLIPYIRMVVVSGSLAMNNAKEESDIDLLIIAQSGRIWTSRAFTTLFMHIIGQRRHGNLTKNRFCLNHYITDQSLKIPWQSLYNAQTYAHLVLVWERKGLYKKFQKANQWINNYLVNYPTIEKGYLTTIESNKPFESIRKLREKILDTWFGNVLEYFLKKIQEGKIKREPLTYKSGGRVTFNDKQLELHPDSPEKKILEKYNSKMIKLGFKELGVEKDSGLTT